MNPWISSQAQIEEFLKQDQGTHQNAVLVTVPSSQADDTLPVGRAIKAALQGPTRTLSMLIGFFGDGARGQTPEDTPLGLLHDEAVEELLLPADKDASHPMDASEFRLLFGALAGESRGSRLAVVGFWWVCRWRRIDAKGADAWRDQLIATWRERIQESPDAKFEQLALEAFDLKEGRACFVAVSTSRERTIGIQELATGIGSSGCTDQAFRHGSGCIFCAPPWPHSSSGVRPKSENGTGHVSRQTLHR